MQADQRPQASTPRLEETPRLAAFLDRLRAQLTRQILLHGAGTLLVVVSAWLLFAFFADVALAVPKAVRWFHLTLLVAFPSFFFWRDLLRPLRKRPDEDGLAILVERANPESHELVVSAVQLAHTPADDPAAPLIRTVLRQADDLAGRLDSSGVLDPRRPRLRIFAGVGSALLAAVIFGSVPEYSSIYFKRLFGSDMPWPQRTHLAIEIPVGDQIPIGPEELHVRVARGGDVPVIVRAAGAVPDSVTLHFDDGQAVILSRSGGDVFRTLLRSCQENRSFHATGGDDRDGLPRVELEVLQPPDVAGIAVAVEPPAYSGLAPQLVFDRDVEVLAGSRVRVHMLPDPPDATGRARILPEDRVLDLVASPYPREPRDAEEGEITPEVTGLSFELLAQETLRYLFELEDSSGLPNPDPGLFAIHVLEDRPPEVEVLAPGRGDVDTVVGGSVPLRIRAEDDFGLGSMSWSAGSAADGTEPEVGGELFLRSVEPARNDATSQGRRRVAALGIERLDVATLAGAEVPVEGQQFALVVSAVDNRAPTAQEGRSVTVRIRVVSAEEFMRRVQDRLARVRLQATSLGELQREKLARTNELLSSLQSDQPADGSEGADVAAALTGQRRVQGDADALSRELAAIVETVLYARIDERAGPLLQSLDERLAQQTDRSFHPEPWTELTKGYGEGRLGSAGLAGKLVDILAVGLQIGEDHSKAAVTALEEAGAHAADGGLEDMADALLTASERQTRTLAAIEALLEQLSEWDNFQSILTLTRDILNRQENLTERTRQFAKDN